MGDDLDLLDAIRKKPCLDSRMPVPAVASSVASSEPQLVDMEARVARAMEQVLVAQREAWEARQEAALLKDQLRRVAGTQSPPSPPLAQSCLVYMDVPAFATLRAEAVSARVELLATFPAPVAESRLIEVATRQLTDFEIENALRKRQAALLEKYGTEEGLAGDELYRKVESRVLQLFRVLHRRRLAILHGHKLPPAGTLFARLPE